MDNGRYIIVSEDFQRQVISELSEIKQLIKQTPAAFGNNQTSELMDITDVMQYLKCCRRTIYKYRKEGMPCEKKATGRTFFWRSEIDKYFGKK